MGTIDRMILEVCRCIECGAKYGHCDCAAKAEQKRFDAEYNRLMAIKDDDEFLAECAKLGVKLDEN